MPIFKKILSISLICLLLTHGQAQASIPTSKPQKPACRLEVQNAHISKTIQKLKEEDVVKVSVLSICNLRQSNVLITLEIHKQGEFGDHTYGPFENQQIAGVNSGLVVKLQDKFVACKNSKLTKWFGVAYSKAFINGNWLYAGRTQSPHIETLPCGT